MAAKKSALVELFWKIHPAVHRWTSGRVGGTMMRMPVLLLTTKGRRSGQPHTKALMYLPTGDRYVVIASYLGEPRHPAWWLNLRANPEAEIQTGSRRLNVVAREAEGQERSRFWDQVVAQQPDYPESAYPVDSTGRGVRGRGRDAQQEACGRIRPAGRRVMPS